LIILTTETLASSNNALLDGN